MSYAANAQTAPDRGWNGPPMWWMHPGWIVLMILGFVFWWPIGLAILVFVLWSKSMGCGRYGGDRWERKMHRMEEKMDRVRSKMERFAGGFRDYQPSSGNHAFDEYRTETLRRLEEEQREFREFLDRLRFAKDKAEFDQFMSDRRNRPEPPRSESYRPEPPAQPPQG